MEFTEKEKKIIDKAEERRRKIIVEYFCSLLLFFAGIGILSRGIIHKYNLDIVSGYTLILLAIVLFVFSRRVKNLYEIIIKFKREKVS